jgi:hypothetical protein
LTDEEAVGYPMHRSRSTILITAIKAMNELESFHKFLGYQLANGDPGLTPEECIDLWRASNPAADESPADVQAIKDALDDMESGDRGVPLQEFLAEVRGKNLA